MIPRLIEELVLSRLRSSGKVILLLGARQVGKTTLLKQIGNKLDKEGKKTLYLNCDLTEELAAINTSSKAQLDQLLTSRVDYLLIDEAQRLDDSGLTLKIIHDNFPSIRVLATGSSSFDLKNKLSDPLTGRYLDFLLYPLSIQEVIGRGTSEVNPLIEKGRSDVLMSQLMLYGGYPDVYLQNEVREKQILLEKIIESYLFRDVLSFERVRNSQAIINLTKALAYQIGSEVNENELANRLKIDRKTVVNYLDILEKAYVIVSVHPFSRNPRREIGRNYKIYFTDLGIRNALIGDFNPLELRSDLGLLWENWLFVERRKLLSNSGISTSSAFWRSYSGAEVDYIENDLTNGKVQTFEFKYQGNALGKGTKSFTKKYKISVKLITKDNYPEFILSNHQPVI